METTERKGLPLTIELSQLFPDAPLPVASDRTLFGSAPLRAVRRCEPFTLASGLGWQLFPPMNFGLRWDGASFEWLAAGAKKWSPLETVEFPGSTAAYVARRGSAPSAKPLPFLSALTEPGHIQVWSGVVARTSPGYCLHVRGPINLPRSAGYDVLEGIIETDQWHGPLVTVLRFRHDRPVIFRTKRPWLLASPVPREVIRAPADVATIRSLADTPDEMLDAYDRSLGIRGGPGGYRAFVRQGQRTSPTSPDDPEGGGGM
jgi:hypothetical protein